MPVLEPGGRRDYGFDYSAEIGNTPSGAPDTITASTWTADAGLTLTGATFNTTNTSVFIEGGVEGETLTATNRVTTGAGRTYERVLTLVIRAAVDAGDDYLIMAADIVQELAPAPALLPVPDTYSPKAARAERLIRNFLVQTSGGAVTSKSLAGLGSKTLSSLPAIKSIVAGVMGSYSKSGKVIVRSIQRG